MATRSISPNRGERQADSSGITEHHNASPGTVTNHPASSGVTAHHPASSGITTNHGASVGGGILRMGNVSLDIQPDGRCQPPSDNMGVEITKGLKAGVHTVSLTCHGSTLPAVLDKVLSLFGCFTSDCVEEREWGGRGYRKSLGLPWGCQIFYGATDGGDHVHVYLAGDAVGAVEFRALQRWFASLPPVFEHPDGRKEGWKCTRLDVYLDAPRERVPDLLKLYLQLREDRSSLRSRSQAIGMHSNDEGTTVTIGKRSSARYVRMYDKRGPVRIELEAKQYIAEQLGQALGEVTDFGEWVRGVIRDAVDFVEPDTNSTRAKLAAWWAWVVESAEKVHVALASTPQSLARVQAWLERQVAPALALMTRARGGALQWFEDLVDDGMKRQTGRHNAIVRVAIDAAGRTVGRSAAAICASPP